MRGRLRYLLAAAFGALFFVIPEPDHGYVAFLSTRSWLLGADSDAPFSQALKPAEAPDDWVAERPELGVMPPLEVEIRPADREQDYARIRREWARSNGVSLGAGPPLRLRVVVDEEGFRSALLSQQSGGWEPVAELAMSRDAAAGTTYYPDRPSLIPAFLAIALAILTGKVIPSLLIGCLAGAFLYAGALGGAPHFVVDTLWLRTLTDDFRFRIMGFVVFLFMAVGVMARSGGIQGMVEWVRRYARGPISSQVCSFVIGILIFFDDYSNCIITGTTMRPLTDRNRVSREKLSYIVDSTAAPIAGISVVSTWIAYEMSMFKDQLPEVTKESGEPYRSAEAFSVFVQTLPYRFYCVFTLILVLLTIVTRREFGPMLAAERRAVTEGKPTEDDAQPMLKQGFDELKPPPDAPVRGRNAFVPVLVLVSVAIGLIWYLGYSAVTSSGPLEGSIGDQLRDILNNTQSELALMWASLAALLVAVALALGQRVLTLRETIDSSVRSMSSLSFAVIILILAWSIGHTCDDLGTATFLTAAFHGRFEPWLLPVVMFLLASLVAFSTGTSYGTMAILLPNVVVLSHTMGESDPTIGGTGLMLLTIGAVLEGSIFGDHCSPISDTTVLSSVATASDHLHHVQTQAPYAALTMTVAMVCGYIPMALISRDLWPLAWIVGTGALVLWLFVVGRRPDAGVANAAAAQPAP